jgi:hypothetical protein
LTSLSLLDFPITLVSQSNIGGKKSTRDGPFEKMTFLAQSSPDQLANSLEFCLWLLVLAGYFRARGRVLSLSLGILLGIRTLAAAISVAISFHHPAWATSLTATFYDVRWTAALLGFGALLFALREIFQHIIAPLPGLTHVGNIVFRWVLLVSLLLSCAVVLPSFFHSHSNHLDSILLQIATGWCALELCLLAFLLLAAHALGFSLRSRIFGTCVGLVMLALADIAYFSPGPDNATPAIFLIGDVATFLSLLTLMVYFLLPEAAREFSHSPMKTLMRWNDLALALHPQEEPQEERTGFLHDVESMVERVLAKNAVKNQ